MYVCHTCVHANHTPSRTNLTDLKRRSCRHVAMVNIISDFSQLLREYWQSIAIQMSTKTAFK